MSTRPFRAGVVGGPTRTGAAWLAWAARVEAAGYDTLLLPDTRHTPSPFPALAAAAAVTSTVRLGTWVLASPLHHPAAVARDTRALQLLSGDRFELGVGTGRPDAAAEAEQLGLPWGSGGDRLRRLAEIVGAVRDQVDPAPPVLVAGAGPRVLTLAGGLADTVALALHPTATAGDVAQAADLVRGNGDPELALSLSGVAGRLVTHLARAGMTAADCAGAAGVLDGDAAAMAAHLHELRERTGVSYLAVAAEQADAFAPVLALLRADDPAVA
ncbi:LLM class flavin-dependent oxidoreductase [Kineococcus rubinsiae]|uniref:LLM class flavin-dependent oxidoreductase n=1 Tax=Kineococcus rubinsiae TaxID=2609562 RepID=UPI001AD8DF84|nr:LLM class flavin-dependent oxidoreductase [Kineococcus rubinsiae]